MRRMRARFIAEAQGGRRPLDPLAGVTPSEISPPLPAPLLGAPRGQTALGLADPADDRHRRALDHAPARPRRLHPRPRPHLGDHQQFRFPARLCADRDDRLLGDRPGRRGAVQPRRSPTSASSSLIRASITRFPATASIPSRRARSGTGGSTSASATPTTKPIITTATNSRWRSCGSSSATSACPARRCAGASRSRRAAT